MQAYWNCFGLNLTSKLLMQLRETNVEGLELGKGDHWAQSPSQLLGKEASCFERRIAADSHLSDSRCQEGEQRQNRMRAKVL
jgi:hypothetical protein